MTDIETLVAHDTVVDQSLRSLKFQGRHSFHNGGDGEQRRCRDAAADFLCLAPAQSVRLFSAITPTPSPSPPSLCFQPPRGFFKSEGSGACAFKTEEKKKTLCCLFDREKKIRQRYAAITVDGWNAYEVFGKNLMNKGAPNISRSELS